MRWSAQTLTLDFVFCTLILFIFLWAMLFLLLLLLANLNWTVDKLMSLIKSTKLQELKCDGSPLHSAQW